MEAPFGGKKLFTVQIEQTILVLAENKEEAEEVARDEAAPSGDIEWNDAMYSAYKTTHVFIGWAHALPFGEGNDQELTCKQILEALEEYEQTRPRTKAELEALGQVPLI